MSNDHPDNGPSLSKAPPKKIRRIYGAPSPAKKQAGLEQTMRDAEWKKRFLTLLNRDGDAWYDER